MTRTDNFGFISALTNRYVGQSVAASPATAVDREALNARELVPASFSGSGARNAQSQSRWRARSHRLRGRSQSLSEIVSALDFRRTRARRLLDITGLSRRSEWLPPEPSRPSSRCRDRRDERHVDDQAVVAVESPSFCLVRPARDDERVLPVPGRRDQSAYSRRNSTSTPGSGDRVPSSAAYTAGHGVGLARGSLKPRASARTAPRERVARPGVRHPVDAVSQRPTRLPSVSLQ